MEKKQKSFSKVSTRKSHTPKSCANIAASFLLSQKNAVKIALKNLEIYQFLTLLNIFII